jgi:hypothetical protein
MPEIGAEGAAVSAAPANAAIRLKVRVLSKYRFKACPLGAE